ncbi:hypothetical protein C8J57DRAFT_1290567, partial [Mycena rebaudengoi]
MLLLGLLCGGRLGLRVLGRGLLLLLLLLHRVPMLLLLLLLVLLRLGRLQLLELMMAFPRILRRWNGGWAGRRIRILMLRRGLLLDLPRVYVLLLLLERGIIRLLYLFWGRRLLLLLHGIGRRRLGIGCIRRRGIRGGLGRPRRRARTLAGVQIICSGRNLLLLLLQRQRDARSEIAAGVVLG